MNDMMLAPAFQRESLFFFVWRAFEEIDPGQTFVPNWHIEAMCEALEDVFHGRTRRLLITVPPRHLKSICASVAFIAWALGKDPNLKILTASYSGKLATQHSDDFRRLVESRWYRHLFPAMRIDPRANRATDLKTTRNGRRFATSVGGSITGFGADITLVDDVLNAQDAHSEAERQNVRRFFDHSLMSRLNDKETGRIIAIQQRLHEDDIAGYLIEKGNYGHLNLPAIAEKEETFRLSFGETHTRRVGDVLFPARESKERLDELRREMGSIAFAAQYQQEPAPPEGAHVRWEWFPTDDRELPRNAFLKVVQSWDLAITAEPTSDYSVCMTFGFRDGKWYLLDVLRRRLEWPDLVRTVRRMQAEWQADTVLIEGASVGISLLQELRSRPGGRAIYMGPSPETSKEERFFGQLHRIERGDIILPKEAPWLADFRRELMTFPASKYDDQVDSLSQFLEWWGSSFGRRILSLDPVTGRYRRPERRRRTHR